MQAQRQVAEELDLAQSGLDPGFPARQLHFAAKWQTIILWPKEMPEIAALNEAWKILND
jgi:hypothetical protein